MASHSPRISVCVPTYNGEAYLRECLDSILRQTFGDFELLLVDDCSSDGTLDLTHSYAVRDRRVRLVPNARNLGLVGNWNRCVKLATGDWVKFVFQDDTIAPTCLARMLDAARQSDAFVACQRELVFEPGTSPFAERWYRAHRELLHELFADEPRASAERCQTLAFECFGLNIFGEPTSVMIRRSAFDEFGLFNPAVVMNCDFEMWLRITIHSGAVFIPEDLATFRVHAGSTTGALLTHKEFRARVLDNLVILHQYLYDDRYEPLRAAARRSSPPIELMKVFEWHRQEARWLAEWAMRDREQMNPRLLSQWKEVTSVYPRIGPSDLSHMAWRIRQRIFPRPEPVLSLNAKRVNA